MQTRKIILRIYVVYGYLPLQNTIAAVAELLDYNVCSVQQGSYGVYFNNVSGKIKVNNNN